MAASSVSSSDLRDNFPLNGALPNFAYRSVFNGAYAVDALMTAANIPIPKLPS